MKKKNQKRKAFTLIELLAVIIVLGILMLIAVPSVTKYINDSREDGYIDTAKRLINGSTYFVNNGELGSLDQDVTYYISSSCIETSNATKSPYGEFTKAYVIVNYNGDSYDYYWVSVDETGKGIKKITSYDNLDTDDLESDLTINDIPNTLGVDARHKYMIIDESNNCGKITNTPTVAETRVSDNGEVDVIDYPVGKTKKTLSLGDIIKIGNEEFYFLRYDGEDIVFIARYNLMVGDVKKASNSAFIKTYGPSDPGYGLQSSEVYGREVGNGSQEEVRGVVSFSTTDYWRDQVGEGKKYPDGYVYDENSIIYQYIENYKTYLEGLGANIKEARTIKFDDITFGSDYYYLVLDTTYWTGYTYLGSNNTYEYITFYLRPGRNGSAYYTSGSMCGVRPTIII